MEITPRERQLLKGIRQSIEQQGYAPTIREMKAFLPESSTSAVQQLLTQLQGKALIDRQPGKARALSLLCSQIPLKGIIQAGYLTEHPTKQGESIRLEGKRYESKDYALQVQGDSMIGAEILAGDIVVLRPSHDLWAIRPGQIAVIWIEGEGPTLKHIYYQEGDSQITLKSANPAHASRTLERSQVGLQGVVVGLHRCDEGLWLSQSLHASFPLSPSPGLD
jgi:repressor LexA